MSADTQIYAVLAGHGTYSASAGCVDAMIARHLPASPEMLRPIVQEKTGLEIGFTDVHDVTTFLIILAHFYFLEEVIL